MKLSFFSLWIYSFIQLSFIDSIIVKRNELNNNRKLINEDLIKENNEAIPTILYSIDKGDWQQPSLSSDMNLLINKNSQTYNFVSPISLVRKYKPWSLDKNLFRRWKVPDNNGEYGTNRMQFSTIVKGKKSSLSKQISIDYIENNYIII